MREKLIELIRKADKEDYESKTQDEHYGFVADRLTESGVVIPVRCKDCKHRYTMSSGKSFCRVNFPFGKKEDDFCSCGERKDNDCKQKNI